MILDGKALSAHILKGFKEEIASFSSGRAPQRPPCLAVFLIGDHPASKIYVNKKIKTCEEIGIRSIRRHFSASITEEELLREIEEININPAIDGLLIQLPLPKHINTHRVIRWVHPDKDVDGFHPINMGKLLLGDSEGFVPCTPLGIKELLSASNISVKEKHVVILGRSNIVGKPTAALFLQDDTPTSTTVSIIHRSTPNPKEICLQADILIVAIGSPKYITADMVKEGAVVIDVGINKDENQKMIGDVDFERVKERCSFITPVPGGVGPMTIAMLMKNTLKSYKKRCDFS